MDSSVVFAYFGAILLVIGIVGCLVPVLPGVPLAWAGLFVAYFSVSTDITVRALIITGIIAAAVTAFDFISPALFTKTWGGTKAGSIGSTIGIFVGLFMGPLGVIAGPFFGALIGEMIHDSSDMKVCLRSATGSFIGFLLGTGIKLIVCIGFAWFFIISLHLNLAASV